MISRDHMREKLPSILEEHGFAYNLFEYTVNQPLMTPEADNKCVIIYGSHQFNRALQGRYTPGSLGLTTRTAFSSYVSNIPPEWLLNHQGVMCTWKHFSQRRAFWEWTYGGGGVFVRPDSGFKTFTGQTISYDNWEEGIKLVDQTSSVMDETMIVVAPMQEILGEFRFVIADRKVVAGSEYRWDDKLDIRRDWPPECEELAQKVADLDWQVDCVYVCDVALTPHGPKIVEVNSFSCAGLYACDLHAVVEAVSAAAYKEMFDI